MENDFSSIPVEKFKDDDETDKTGSTPACVTFMVCSVIPVPVTETVAVRGVDSVLAIVVTVAVPLPDPEEGETVSHEVLLATDHLIVFDSIEND